VCNGWSGVISLGCALGGSALALSRREALPAPALFGQARGMLAARTQCLYGVTQPIHALPPQRLYAAIPRLQP